MDIEYDCSPYTKSTGFTELMHLVLNTREHPELNNLIPFFSIRDINAKNTKGWTPFMLACRNSTTKSSIDTIIILYNNGADINENDNKILPLMLACMANNIEVVKLLLVWGVNVNIQDNIGWTSLMWISRYTRNVDIAQLLLEHGADVNIKDNTGWTALMLASRNSNNESSINMVLWLLEHNAEINVQNDQGWTAFMLAAAYSNTDSSPQTVKLLLDHNVDITLKNNNDCSILMTSCNKECNLAVFTMLLQHKDIYMNAKDNLGWTALMYAANGGLTDFVEILLEHGCDVDIKNYNHITAIQLCTMRDIIKLLLTRMDLNMILFNGNPLIDYMVDKGYYQEYFDEAYRRYKLRLIQTKIYERTLKNIHEHDAAIRYKIGNMGYKICKYYEDKIVTDEILHYLSATPATLDKLVNDYLGY